MKENFVRNCCSLYLLETTGGKKITLECFFEVFQSKGR